jgi:hypothetical protein
MLVTLRTTRSAERLADGGAARADFTASASKITPARRGTRESLNPTPAAECGTLACGRGPGPARAVGHLNPHRADPLGDVQPPAGRRANSAWLTGTARSAAASRRSYGSGPPPEHDAGNQTRTPAARRMTRSLVGTPPRADCHAGIDRSGHGHTMATGRLTTPGPSARSAQTT